MYVVEKLVFNKVMSEIVIYRFTMSRFFKWRDDRKLFLL